MKINKWIFGSTLLLTGSSLLTMSCSSHVAEKVKEFEQKQYDTIEEIFEDDSMLKNAFNMTEGITGVKYQENVESLNLLEKASQYEKLSSYDDNKSLDETIEYQQEDGYVYNKIDDTYYPVDDNLEMQVDSTVDSIYEAGQFFNQQVDEHREELNKIMDMPSELDDYESDFGLLTGEYSKEELKNEYFSDESSIEYSLGALSAILVQTGISALAKNTFLASATISVKTFTSWWVPLNIKWKIILASLAVLVIVIVVNWLKVRHAFPSIIHWFIHSLSKFGTSIAAFFDKTGSQAKESLYTHTRTINNEKLQLAEYKNATIEKNQLYAAIRASGTLLISKYGIYNKHGLRTVLMSIDEGTYTKEPSFAKSTLIETLRPIDTDFEIDGYPNPKPGYFYHYHGYKKILTGNKIIDKQSVHNGHSWFGVPNV